MITLQSIQVGLPQTIGDVSGDASLERSSTGRPPIERPWTSGFIKQPVAGLVRLEPLNLAGDGQADLVHHGGLDKAVCVYPAAHYPYWRARLELPDLVYGSFGENFTVAGQVEEDVCVGDVWQIGDSIVQISQPRQPCWKLARRWRIKDLALQVQTTGFTGWYFRVLQPGYVEAGLTLHLLDRPNPKWTVSRANHVMHTDKANLAMAQELEALSQLSASWKATLQKRVAQLPSADPNARLLGPNA